MIINHEIVKAENDNNVIDKFVVAQSLYALSEGNQVDGCSNVLAQCTTCQYKRICDRIDIAVKQTFDDYNRTVKTFNVK